MAELVGFSIDDGGMLIVEVDDAGGVVRAGRTGDLVDRASKTLETALDPVVSASRSLLAKLREARPHEVEVEFGVKLTSEAGAVIAKATGECHLNITLKWAQADERDAPTVR